ncbi:unnamed protein product [Symbiodinium sp. CCMP2592]|nr:unnamed protein product [Symbiodinium sp. CCMP2592]
MAQQGAQAAHVPVDDIDDDLPELEAAVGPQLPQPMPNNPFLASPAASPSQGQIVLGPAQLNALFEQLAEATRAASDAAAAAAAAATSSRDGPPTLTGKDMYVFAASTREQEHTSWPGWFWSFQQYLSALDPGYGPDLEALEANPGSVIAKGQGTIAQQARSRQLYSLLAALIRGRGYMIVRQTESGNGLEALRQLMSLFAPRSQGRSLGILTAITQVPSFKPSEALLPQILDLERVFTSYEQSASETLQGSVKTALLLRCLPANTKNQIYASLPEDATYTQVREASLRIERQHFKWQSVSYFGTVREATAQRHDEATQMEIVECYNCGRKGHYSAECWRSKGQANVHQVVNNPTPSEAAASTVGPSASQAASQATTAVRRIEIDLSAVGSGTGSGSGGIHMITQAMSAPRPDQVLLEPYPSDEVLLEPNPSEAMSAPRPDPVLLEPYPSEATSAPEPDLVPLEPFPSEFIDLVHATLPAMTVPDSLVRNFEPAAPMYDMSYSDSEGEWTFANGSLSVVTFAPEHQVCAIHQDIEIVLDSGADHSCLPAAFGSTGTSAPPLQATFRDAQGNVISPTSVRNAKLDLGPLTITETWLIGPVTTPLLSLGKLYCQGFTVGRVNNELKLFREGDEAYGVPVFMKHNSLCVRGSIRVMQSDAPQAGQAGHPPASPGEHHAPQSQTSSGEPHAPQSQTSSCEPHAPQSQSSTPQGDFHVNALTVTLHGPWLSLKAPFVQIDTGLVANKCTSLCYVDCTLAFPSLPIAFRTTLHNSPRGWLLHTLNEDLSTLDDFEVRFEAAFPRPKMYETITIGSTYRLDVRQLFPEHSDHPLVAVPVPEESDGDPSPDAAMDLDVNIDAGGVGLGANGGDADEGESPGAAGNAPGEKPVVVDGTELTLDCTLATLRAAAQSLGIGKSGGKATVLKRIKEFLARNDFLWANLPADVQLPREQAPVREPSQDEVRKHSLTHMPFQAWCAECVQRRARSDRHERHPVGDREHATICFDFAYTSRPETPEQKLVCLVASCNFTGANQAWPVPAKGGNLQLRYMTSELTRWIATLGHSEVTLRSDPEPVCLSLQKLVQAQRLRLGLRTHLEQSEPDDHAANAAEPAVETLRQLTNTLLSEFESRAGVKVASLDAMHAWAWRHASFIQQRFTRSQGQTPFELACGRPYQGKLVCIGETVYGRVKSAVKGQPRWGIGLWLGKLGCSDGHIVFTASGHFLACRSIRRLPQTYLRSADFAKRLRDHPYSQAAFLAGQVGQCRPQKTRDAQQAPPEPQPDESVPAGADPLPYPGYVLPDNAPLSELVPPPAIRSDFVPEPPTPMQEDSGPVTPLQPAPSDAEVVSSPLAVVPDAEVLAEGPNADRATGSSDPASSSEPAAVRVPTRAAEPSANEPRKRLRLDAVTFEGVDMYHNHEENDFEFEGEILEDFDYAAEADGAHDDTRLIVSLGSLLLSVARAQALDHPFCGDMAEDTCTSVMINGERLYFKLLRLLPGQREGSQTWFYQFTDALKVGSRVELMQEVPSLFRFQPEDGGGGGLVHVDDLLGTGPASVIKCMTDHLERDYKVTVNLISVPGQEVHFLKKRHYLLSSTELLIEVSPKHLEKLKSLCGHPKHRKSPLPSGRLPTEKEDDAPLSQDQAFRFRSAVGVLYVVPDRWGMGNPAAFGLLEVLPAPTRTNVADIGTKLLGVQRTATGSLGAEDGDDAKDDDATLTVLDAILESLVQIVGYASAVYEAYPSTCVAVCQCVAITAFLMCAFMCCGRRMTDVPEASVQVRIASGVAVDVRTSRSEPKAKAGEQVRGARPKTASRPKIEDDDERAQSPGAHEVHAGRPGSSNDVLRSNSEASGRSERIPKARPIPQRRVPQARSADGVWISTSQGYAYHKATCGKLNQSLGVTEVSRAVAEERGYRACRICKP